MKIRSLAVRNSADIEAQLDLRTEVIGIDEAQFLGMELVDFVVRLADMGKRIIIAGLDTDYLGRPFHPIPELLAVADEITKTLAICMQCGNPAKHTQRLVASEDLIVVGTSGKYEARCRRCFEPNLAKLEKPEPAVRAKAAESPEIVYALMRSRFPHCSGCVAAGQLRVAVGQRRPHDDQSRGGGETAVRCSGVSCEMPLISSPTSVPSRTAGAKSQSWR